MFKLLCFVVVLFSISAPGMWAQNLGRTTPNLTDMANAGNPATSAANEVDPVQSRMEIAAMQRENQNRQATLKQDTDKLLALATELKQNVDRTGPNILSVDVVKKAQEIEKLAKSVKDKMKGE
jgi:hypothetical protein